MCPYTRRAAKLKKQPNKAVKAVTCRSKNLFCTNPSSKGMVEVAATRLASKKSCRIL